jgi:IS30 family transposase
MAKVEEKTSALVTQKIIELFQPWKQYLHTMTSDNGAEFAKHETIAKALNVDFYFAKTL